MNSLTQRIFHAMMFSIIYAGTQLHAATAQDIQGEWSIDGVATWEAMRKLPQFVAAPPDQLKEMGPMIIAQLSAMTCTITTDKIISTGGPQTETESYRVLSIDGDTVKTESENSDGKKEKTDVLVKGDILVLTYPGQAGKTLVLKRKAATIR